MWGRAGRETASELMGHFSERPWDERRNDVSTMEIPWPQVRLLRSKQTMSVYLLKLDGDALDLVMNRVVMLEGS